MPNPKRRALLFVMAAVIGAVLLPMSAGLAQAGPQPVAEPAYFRGSVTINGEAAPDGTPIEALNKDTVCGTATTSEGRYSITVNTSVGEGPDFQEGCGGRGDDVLFLSGDVFAAERGTFLPGLIQDLDLTFGDLPEEPTPIGSQIVSSTIIFSGSVTLNGAPAPDGTPIEAIRGLDKDIVCGETTTENGEYMLRVLSGFGTGEDFGEGCHGSEVVFRSGDLIAAEVGDFTGLVRQEPLLLTKELDLTFEGVAELPDTGAAGGSGTAVPPWLLWALAGSGIAAMGAAASARRVVRRGG